MVNIKNMFTKFQGKGKVGTKRELSATCQPNFIARQLVVASKFDTHNIVRIGFTISA
jgi:hypothetical protein